MKYFFRKFYLKNYIRNYKIIHSIKEVIFASKIIFCRFFIQNNFSRFLKNLYVYFLIFDNILNKLFN